MDHGPAQPAGKPGLTGETLVIIRPLSLVGIAALAILVSHASSAAEGLGRLFFNPEQRAQMDLARSKRIRTTLSEEPEEQQSASLPETLTYNGLVRRSDGKNTVWLNGRSVPEGEMGGRTPVNSKLRWDGSLVIELPQANRSINLRVGQELEITSGSISEPYVRVAPVTKPAPKPAPESGKPASAPAPSKAPDPRGNRDEEARSLAAQERAPAAGRNSASGNPRPPE